MLESCLGLLGADAAAVLGAAAAVGNLTNISALRLQTFNCLLVAHTHTPPTLSPALFPAASCVTAAAWLLGRPFARARKKGALIKIRARNSRWSTNKKNNNDNNNNERKTLAQMSLLFGHFRAAFVQVRGEVRGGRNRRVRVLFGATLVAFLCMLDKCPAAFFGHFTYLACY